MNCRGHRSTEDLNSVIVFLLWQSEGRNLEFLVYEFQLFCKEIYSLSAETRGGGVYDMQTGVKHEVIIEAQISSLAWGKKENSALTKGNSK